MGVIEARENGPATEVDLANAGGYEIQDIGITANGEKAAIGNGHSLSMRLQVIDGEDIRVVQNQVGFFALEREHRECSKRAEKFAASRFV